MGLEKWRPTPPDVNKRNAQFRCDSNGFFPL